MWMNDYVPVEDERFDVEDGRHRVRIDGVEQITTKNGRRAIEITLAVAGSKNRVPYFDCIFEGEYFNKKATRVFDAFRIPRANWNFNSWLKKTADAEFEHVDEEYTGNDGKKHTANKCKLRYYHNTVEENVAGAGNAAATGTGGNQVPDTVAAIKQAFNGAVCEDIKKSSGNEEFPEDIPF